MLTFLMDYCICFEYIQDQIMMRGCQNVDSHTVYVLHLLFKTIISHFDLWIYLQTMQLLLFVDIWILEREYCSEIWFDYSLLSPVTSVQLTEVLVLYFKGNNVFQQHEELWTIVDNRVLHIHYLIMQLIVRWDFSLQGRNSSLCSHADARILEH